MEFGLPRLSTYFPLHAELFPRKGFHATGSPEISRLVGRLVNCSNTHNQALASLISLEKRMTPEERKVVLDEVDWLFRKPGWLRRAELGALEYLRDKEMTKLTGSRAFRRAQRLSALRYWAHHLAGHAGLASNQPLQKYHRAWSRGGKILFQKGPQRSSSVVICFTDGQGRIMMSVADFLQAWEIKDTDVLFVWPRSDRRFYSGIAEFGQNMREGVLGLGKYIQGLGYSQQYTLGASSGATAALLYSLLNDTSRLLLAGPLSTALELLADEPGKQLVDKEFGGSLKARQVTVVYGEDSDRDKAVAERFSRNWGCPTVIVPDSSHVCLYSFLERSMLTELFQNVFDPT